MTMLQEVDLVDSLVESGFSQWGAEAYLDTCPALVFSVWCLCGTDQPSAWQRGFACVVLDNGEDSGAGQLILSDQSFQTHLLEAFMRQSILG